MDAFGVRFYANNSQRFKALQSLYVEIKLDKDAGQFRDQEQWVRLVPDDIKGRFFWPTREDREKWLSVRDSTLIAISSPSEQLGSIWDFYRVFEAIEEGECESSEEQRDGQGKV
jgi:hypothetical protein